MDPHAFDEVLRAKPPRFTVEEASTFAEDTFGAQGTAHSLGSERDQTFLIEGPERRAVMKVSNSAESSEQLDMEALGVLHAHAVDLSLPIALPWVAPGADPDVDGAAAYRVTLQKEEHSHFVRMYDVIPGRASVDESGLSDDALRYWGETTARVGKALRGFHHAAADRVMLWDVQNAPLLRPLVPHIEEPRVRDTVSRVLDRFDEVVAPLWPSLRAQVIHGDLCSDNVLMDDDGFICGIIDFGDMSHTALVTDIAAVLESVLSNRSSREMIRAARLVVDGFQRATPLETEELRILGELAATRACANVVISSWRAAEHLEDAEFTMRYTAKALEIVENLEAIGYDEIARQLGGRPTGVGVAFEDLRSRRKAALGSALAPLTYEKPLHIVRGDGPWLFDAEGARYLDAYNNVPVVGHCHPRVTEAIVRQARTLNTNMRYLHETVVELAERLIATMPDGLDTVMFVNSGSEANDLAWRLATTATGNSGGICTGFAYHGVSEAIAALSPENWPGGRKPEHIETFDPPDSYRGLHMDTGGFAAALDRLAAGGRGIAATYLDGILTSDGILDLEPEFVQDVLRQTHEAGGLWVADEVQGGYGRTGDTLWSFERFGIVPDFVTLGKPMGNGHPVAAVITRNDIVDRFAETTDYFSTFGGNPVAAAAALAVLDVVEDERIMQNAAAVGEQLREGLLALMDEHPSIGDVRGMGLANGVEIVADRGTREPDPALADRVMNGLRERGVLVGTTGARSNTLKVRPPLVFGSAEAALLLRTLAAVLTDLGV